ncbi:MAG: hypothetical protein WD534_03675 [Phycisphaeraceae bacterium]
MARAEAGEPEEVSPLLRVHQLLRGRYVWAILLGVCFAAIGGTAAWFSVEPVYESRGMVHIRPAQDVLIYPTEDSEPMHNFSGFVGTQAALMKHNRVLRHALDNEAWRSFGRGSDDHAMEAFRDKLSVNHPRGNEFVVVTFEDPNREAASVAVRAVLQAYERIHVERDRLSRDRTMRALEDRRRQLDSDLDTITRRIQTIAEEYGSDALESMYQFQLSQVQRLEAQIQQTQMALNSLRAQQRDADEAVVGDEGINFQTLTLEEIAAVDRRMRDLIDQRYMLQQRIKLMERNFGANHREVRTLRDRLAITNEAIDEHVQTLNAADDPERMLIGDRDNAVTPGRRITQLEAQLERLQAMHAEAHPAMIDLGRKRLEIDKLQAERDTLRKRLDETIFRYETLEVESVMAGHIDVMANPGDIDTSLTPVNARKRIQMAGVSVVGGGGLGLGLVLLLGLIDRRMRSADDATRSLGHLPLLGVLPQLPDDLTDPEHATLVAHSVHHIRTLLQLSSPPQGSAVYTVSSAAAGSGKTSLTIALGMSFANAGNSTLIVDCDLTSAGLTRRMQALVRRRIGQVLLQQGLVDREQLDQGLHAAEVTGRRLGEALIAQGAVTEEQLDQALAFQEQSAMGLLDAMHGDAITDCTADTGTEHLTILPVGGATVADLKRLSPKAIKRVIDSAREHYEVILVDTGPVPGSMESSSVAAAADSVVFVVSRGDQRPRVERSIAFLESLGASLAGFVFNRAESNDEAISTYSTMSERMPDDADHGPVTVPARRRTGHNGQTAGYGPVADALSTVGKSSSQTNGRHE